MRLFVLNVLTCCSVLALETSMTNSYPTANYGTNSYAPNAYYQKMPMIYKKNKGPEYHIHKHFHNVNIVIWVFLFLILGIFIKPKKNHIVIVNKKSGDGYSSGHSSDSSSSRDSYDKRY